MTESTAKPKASPGAILGAAAVLGAGALTLTSQKSTPPPTLDLTQTSTETSSPTKWAVWVSKCRKRDGVHVSDAVKIEKDSKKQTWCTWADGTVELYVPSPVQGDYGT